MKIGCVCPTYKRPELLGRAIYCFLQQIHTASFLLVIDDAGQYRPFACDRWRLVTTPKRFNSLGGKRQAGISLLPKDCEGYLCWDDDDVYWPDAIAAVSYALEQKPWAQCRQVYESVRPDLLKVVNAYRKSTWGYGGCWAYRLAEHRAVGGYVDNPARSSNDDLDLAAKFQASYGDSANSTPDGLPWYWFNRDPGVAKIAQEGVGFWQSRAKWPTAPTDFPPIGWNGTDIYSLPVLDGIMERPF